MEVLNLNSEAITLAIKICEILDIKDSDIDLTTNEIEIKVIGKKSKITSVAQLLQKHLDSVYNEIADSVKERRAKLYPLVKTVSEV